MSRGHRKIGEVDDLARVLDEMSPAQAAAYEDANARAELVRGLAGWRKRHRINQRAVAEAMDTTQSAVSELESTGIDPRLSTLQRYARALGRRLQVTVTNADEPDLGAEMMPSLLDSGFGQVLKELLRALPGHRYRSPDQIVRQTGLSEAVVCHAVTGLSNSEWIHAAGGTPQVLTLNENRALVVGVSIRADGVRGVITNLRAEVPRAVESAELPSGDPDAVVGVVARLVESLTSTVGHRSEIIGLGVELAGLVDRDFGDVLYAPDLEPRSPRWRGFPLRTRLQNVTGLRTVVDNDANALAVHEYLRRGDVEELAVVLIGEQGIGGGLILDGRLLRGRQGITGEIGHVVVDPDGEPCRHTSQRGCLETIASPAAIARTAGTRDLREAADRARGEDRRAEEAFRAAGTALGQVLATLTSVTAPSLIVIYARAELAERDRFTSARTFADAAKARLDAAWFTQVDHKIEIVTCELDDAAGALGAASVAVGRFLDRPLRWLSGPQVAAPQRFDESLLAQTP